MTEDNDEKIYKITIEGENEIDGIKLHQQIAKNTALRILSLLMGGEIPTNQTRTETIKTTDTGAIPDPKTFMAEKKPNSDVEKITCLAYYLSKYQNVTQFKTQELTELNTMAAQPRFSNATVAARNAVQQLYLALAGKGKKQITSVGDLVVEALPNRSKVKEVLEENARASRRRKAKKISKKEEQITK